MRPGPALRACAAIAAAIVLTACSGAGEGPSTTGLEKTALTIGVSPTPSSAPVFIADRKGFFKEEGLTVRTEVIQAPQTVMPKILNGSMDIFKGSYVSLINIQDSGAAKIKILHDSLAAAPGIAGVVVMNDSPLRGPKDLKGRTVAVNSLDNLGTMSMSAHLKAYDLPPEEVKFVVVNFEAQLTALKQSQVDAAWMVEPFLSAAQQAGARLLLDTNTGPTDALPIDGWAATEEWTARHPRTVAAFQRAVSKAQRLAATDRAVLAEVVPLYTQTPKEAVMTMAMGTFPTSLNATRIQRVADLMYEFGYLRAKVDVASMVVPIPEQ